jgi:glyoxylase-like metal-dependent hydrolase (beta-lactamase superfamily II)
MTVQIEPFFDPVTSTLTYLVLDPDSGDAVLIDPVRDFDVASGVASWREAERVAAVVAARDLRVHLVLETHAHADHLSGAPFWKDRFGARVVISSRIVIVQAHFRDIFDLGPDFPVDGRQFDVLVEDGQVLDAGSLRVHTIATPGHTPACVTWRIEDALFTGDALFLPDQGVGRCDFPRGDAEQLYDSVQERIYSLPEEWRIFVGHDYQPGGRPLGWQTTVRESKERNIQLPAGLSRADFVTRRRARDARLSAPRLLLPSIQVNIAAGRLPDPAPNGTHYLKMPLRV